MTDGPDITKYVAIINLIASLNLREKTLMVVVLVVDLFLLFSKLSTKTVGVWSLLLNKFDDVSSLIYQFSFRLLITAKDKTRLVQHEIRLKPQAKRCSLRSGADIRSQEGHKLDNHDDNNKTRRMSIRCEYWLPAVGTC